MHCTPRTYAMLFLQENIISINEQASILGHSSPKITLEHYSAVLLCMSMFTDTFSLHFYKKSSSITPTNNKQTFLTYQLTSFYLTICHI